MELDIFSLESMPRQKFAAASCFFMNLTKVHSYFDAVILSYNNTGGGKKKGKVFCLIWVMFDLQDSLVETAKEEASSISNIIVQATK